MNTYSMAEAAAQLHVTRQTLYKHVNRNKDLYTVTVDEKQRITNYGMELLQGIVQANKKKTVTADTGAHVSTQGSDQLVSDLQEKLTMMEKLVSDLQAKLTESEKKIAMMEGALQVKDADYIRAMETLSRPGIITTWVKRLFAGKTTRGSGMN